jgi:hypothetical protein
MVVRLLTPTVKTKRSRGRWRTDPILLNEQHIRSKIQHAWGKWKNGRRYYNDEVMWWERCVKPQLQRLLRQETAKKANWRAMENHLHACINDIIKCTKTPTEKFLELKRYKAKLIRHHAESKRKILQDVPAIPGPNQAANSIPLEHLISVEELELAIR